MVAFSGVSSVLDRTLFTHRGPINKRRVEVLTGSNLRIVSNQEIEIPTGNFSSVEEKFQLSITGSGGRNDGIFNIKRVINSTRLLLDNTDFNITDESATLNSIIIEVNNLKLKYNQHLSRVINGIHVHGTDDLNTVTIANCTDLSTAIILINDIKLKYSTHLNTISGTPPVHKEIDDENIIYSLDATNLTSILNLLNELRKNFNNHILSLQYHQQNDFIDKLSGNRLIPIIGTFPSPLTGPFNWVLYDPMRGMPADDAYDVEVRINNNPAVVDAVFGLLGAVILQNKPGPTDTVDIDYNFIEDPASGYFHLNSFEFVLNQDKSHGYSGFPNHNYPSRSHLINTSDIQNKPIFNSAFQPYKKQWKYKAYERAYTACLNDPNTLLLNVPTNKLTYPVLSKQINDQTISYDPITLPNQSTNPWDLKGNGVFSLSSAGNQLTIIDKEIQTGTTNYPPFYSKNIKLETASIISAAFRVYIDEQPDTLTLDGVFTGVGFGISDGYKVGLVGFLITEANNLSSFLSLINQIKDRFNDHIQNGMAHNPLDTNSFLNYVNAIDLETGIILINVIKDKYLNHIAKGSGAGIHQTIDSINTIVNSNATDLLSALLLANEIRIKFNQHLTQSYVHFVDDEINIVSLIKQIGILTDVNYPEFDSAWSSCALDWTKYNSYRIFRDAEGNVSVYLSGNLTPIISVNHADLLSFSKLDADFESAQQVFFGSISKQAKNISYWQFIRVNISPVSSNLIENSKKVDYTASILPTLDTNYPWIDVGQNGYAKIVSGNILVVDSTANAQIDEISSLGIITGAYFGYVRLEPIISDKTTVSLEFSTAVDYYTFGVDNQCGVYIEDNDFSIQCAFLQYDPLPATITTTIGQPFNIIPGDTLIVKIGNQPQQTVTFTAIMNLAASIVSQINSQLGFIFASSDSTGRIKLTSVDVGSTATFSIISGSSLIKLGISPGSYTGSDNNPEPKLAWFGANEPDQDSPAWIVTGSQPIEMLGRTLRINDNSVTDYRVYTESDYQITNQILNYQVNWKLNIRLAVRSFSPGGTIPAIGPYLTTHLIGAFTSIDEGPTGKNAELQLAIDNLGNKILDLLSYNEVTQQLDLISQYSFNWNDNEFHTYNIYTSKNADLILVYADGDLLSPLAGPIPTYSGLNSGVAQPAISFGSGSEPVVGIDLKSSRSVVDWESVAVFRDNKLDNPNSASYRYFGIYKGGDKNQLSSYYLYQIDWTNWHTYRIVRDPSSAVSIYIDGNYIPVISISYDSLSLPLSKTSFFQPLTETSSFIAFGSFNPQELSRFRWSFVRYSIGSLTLTDLLIPPHQVLNQANVIASPDHLYTKKFHTHQGFRVYSGGTPLDDFMSDHSVEAYTNLLENVAPVPMTEDLDSRGGLRKIATPVASIPSIDLIDVKGFLSNFEDDLYNQIITKPVLSIIIEIINSIRTVYESHRINSIHPISDVINVIVSSPAIDLPTAITLINEIKSVFNAHRVQAGVHLANDLANIIIAPDATDIISLILLTEECRIRFNNHRLSIIFHLSQDIINSPDSQIIPIVLDNCLDLTNELKNKYLLHLIQYNVHLANDIENNQIYDIAIDLPTAIIIGNDFKDQFNKHRVAIILETQYVHTVGDTVNIINNSDAIDLDSLCSLLNESYIKYNSHLIQPGIHGSAVFVRLDPPSRVLYEGMKFWINETGDLNLISPFCDHKFMSSTNINYFGTHSLNYEGDVLPETENWEIAAGDINLVSVSLQTEPGPIDFLRYGTLGPTATLYSIISGLPSHPSLDFEIDISMRINSFSCNPNADTGIFVGFVSPIGPGVTAGLGFDALNAIPYVKIQDTNNNQPLYRIPFNWADQQFHTYRIIRNVKNNSLQLIVIS